MLTLVDSRRIGTFTVYRDVVYAEGRRRWTSTFYVLADAPRIARDADGPMFDFLWYRRRPDEAETGARAGGLLTVTVELGPAAAEREALRADLAREFGVTPIEAVQVLPLPVSGGSVALSFAGEGPGGGDLVTRVAGAGAARLVGVERSTFLVELTADGAALLATAIEGGERLLHARWDLGFEHHLDAVKLTVFADLRRARAMAAALLTAGVPAGRGLRESLEIQRICGVDVECEEPLLPAHIESLLEYGRLVLDEMLASAMDRTADAALHHTFGQAYPLVAAAVVDGLLAPALTEAERARAVRLVDLSGAPVKDVRVMIAGGFEAGAPLRSVKLTWDYDETGEAGRVVRHGELLLDAEHPTATFRFDPAAPALERYRYRAELFFDGMPPLALDPVDTDEEIVVLDFDGVGAIALDVELGDVPLSLVRQVIVEVEEGGGDARDARTHRLFLDGAHPRAAIRAAVEARDPGPLRLRASWLLDGERRIEGEVREVARGQRTVQLDAPRIPEVEAEVAVVAAGAFEGLSLILVELQVDAVDGERAELTFERAGETKWWRPRMIGGGTPGPLRYRARCTFVEASGIRRGGEWTVEDSPVLLVRDLARFDVQIVARLLDLGGTWRLARVELTFDDEAAGLHEAGAFVLRDRTTSARFSFRVAAADRHAYRYRLTRWPAAGESHTGPWRDGDSEILVLGPDDAA